MNLHWHIISHPISTVTLGFTLGVVQPMSLDKCVMRYIRHYNNVRSIFTASQISCALPRQLSLPPPLQPMTLSLPPELCLSQNVIHCGLLNNKGVRGAHTCEGENLHITWLPQNLVVPQYPWGIGSEGAQLPFINWCRSKHRVGPAHQQTPNHGSKTVQVFTGKKMHE